MLRILTFESECAAKASLPFITMFQCWDTKNEALHLNSLQQLITTFYHLVGKEG